MIERAPAENAIGVFDSGLGGLTVAAAIAQALPSEDIVYLGDTARVPYGTRSPATVVRYARKNVAFLRTQGVKLVVVACNTVSAQGLGGLADGSTLPIIGVIRPGAQAAIEASGGGSIGVLGTPATVRSNAYVNAIHELAPGRRVHQIPCPLFVPLVEEGWLHHEVTERVAVEYLGSLEGSDIDTVILGCTHYPLLRSVIERTLEATLGRPITVVDSATAVAGTVAQFLSRSGLAKETMTAARRFFVTDAPDRVGEVGNRFWGDALGETLALQHVDIVDFPA